MSPRRIATASFIGTAIEFYDFYIYGTAAALVFGTLFFPDLDRLAGTLAALATFGAGFVARPVGAVAFGHFGDRIGRKATLVVSLLTMGVGTVAIGVLPTYDTIGIAAPLLLVLCRFLQGFGLGGEWGGAVLMATEHAPPGRRGLYSSFPQLGPAVGFVVASGAFLLLSAALTDEQFASWGWRVPFLASAVLVVVGLYIRVRIAETPVFEKAMREQEQTRAPIVDVVRRQPRSLLLATGGMIITYAIFYSVTTFSLAYGTADLGLSRTMLLVAAMVAATVMGVATPVLAVLSDRVGRRRVCLWSCALAVVWAFPLFALLGTGDGLLITLGFSVAMIAFAGVFAPMGAFLPELFATRYRYTGASIGYNAASIVGGGIAPLVATGLTAAAGASWPVSLLVAFLAILSGLSIWALPETRSTDLSDATAFTR
ncbi:MFS transporter [Pseudonocardia sp. HH130630-07]|uniref:MFS transporter n=1 Tax=Pseudonocardia sp. HH130630-07 TaxID=1690815 RepID=UPI000815380E|nr:MFS transporter [Pseudonocardia sp. HH130630-07]ANY08047.1 MFS transporter [Pseudonocardia sp. HH130630-07]